MKNLTCRVLMSTCMILLSIGAQAVRAHDAPDEPEAGTMIVHPEDGAVMVWVPSGAFTMGINADTAMDLAEKLGYDHYHKFAAEEWFPQRKVYVQGFFVDKYEVTVARWKRYVELSSYEREGAPRRWPKEPQADAYDLYPVTRVLWGEAQQYASYFGKALPLERQWEKAARGTDARLYPWGNEMPTKELGAFTADIMGKENSPTSTYPVGSFPKGASPYGCMDMSGNVYEWTSEWHEPYPNNPERKRMLSYMGHKNGCLRGGSFYHAAHALPAVKRFGFRPDETYFHVGFRTVWTPPDGWFETAAFEKAKSQVEAREKAIDEKRQATPRAPRNF